MVSSAPLICLTTTPAGHVLAYHGRDQPFVVAHCLRDLVTVRSDLDQRWAGVRVVACPRNVGLIAGLVNLPIPVWLGAPERADQPEAELAWLWHPPYVSRGSPFWSLTYERGLGYLLAWLHASGYAVQATDLLPRHPAWRVLRFARRPMPVAQVLSHIVDPTWFRHPQRPERWTRLYSYFGVRPAHAASLLDGSVESTAAGRRFALLAALVFQCPWLDSDARRSPLVLLRASRQLLATLARYWEYQVAERSADWPEFQPNSALPPAAAQQFAQQLALPL